ASGGRLHAPLLDLGLALVGRDQAAAARGDVALLRQALDDRLVGRVVARLGAGEGGEHSQVVLRQRSRHGGVSVRGNSTPPRAQADATPVRPCRKTHPDRAGRLLRSGLSTPGTTMRRTVSTAAPARSRLAGAIVLGLGLAAA